MGQVRQFLDRCDETGDVGDVADHDHLRPRRNRLLEQADDLIDALWRRRDLDVDDFDPDALLEAHHHYVSSRGTVCFNASRDSAGVRLWPPNALAVVSNRPASAPPTVAVIVPPRKPRRDIPH